MSKNSRMPDSSDIEDWLAARMRADPLRPRWWQTLRGRLAVGGANGVKWSYGYNAMPGDVDPLADAEKIAAHWESLGMTVRINTDHAPVVFATGGPLQGLSFSTGPGLYGIGGTSACVPGDPNQIRDQLYPE